jgi:hypothetical protein
LREQAHGHIHAPNPAAETLADGTRIENGMKNAVSLMLPKNQEISR